MTIQNILMTAPVHLGETHLDGQVLVISTNEFQAHSPSKRNPNYKLTFPVFIDPADAPADSKGDLNWLLPQNYPGGRLRSAFIVLEFEPDTLPMPEVTG